MEFASAEPTSPARKWTAITVASLVAFVAYWSILLAFVTAADEESTRDPAAPFALGMALIPFAFLALAFLSRHRRWPGAVLKALALFLLIGLPVGAFVPPVGLVAGLGAGGIVTLRADGYPWKPRAVAVGLAAVYTLVVMFIAPPLGVFAGSVLPFTSLGAADYIIDRRSDDQPSELA